MRYLIELADREDVSRVVTAATAIPSVQGVVLEPDSYWLYSWNIFASGDRRAQQIATEFRYYFARLGFFPPFRAFYGPVRQEADYHIPFRPVGLSDLKWHPDDWEWYIEALGLKGVTLPIVLKICLLPGAKRETQELPRFEGLPFRVVYEVRPRAFCQSDPKRQWRPLVGGVSIGNGPGIYGTLGGILQASKKQRYGLTCAHIFPLGQAVDQPARYDSAKTSNIGTRNHGTTLVPSPQGGLCNPITASNEVDAALIDLGAVVPSNLEVLDIGTLAGLAKINSMSVGQTAETTGRTSGHRRLEIGGLAVTYRLAASPAGPEYCFKNLFELRWPYSRSRPPVQAGDSGSWVCIPGGRGFEWCGMVIGGDRLNGYAVFAEQIEQWWQAPPISMQLSVV